MTECNILKNILNDEILNKDKDYIINKLNECTHYQNIRWCELFVLTTLESHGITNTFPYWGAPMFEVENMLQDLCECEIPLLSFGMFGR